MDDFVFIRNIMSGFASRNDMYMLEMDDNISLRRIFNIDKTDIVCNYYIGYLRNNEYFKSPS